MHAPAPHLLPPVPKRRILCISGLFHPEVGGTEQECGNLARALQARGHTVSVLTQHRPGSPGTELREGLPIHRAMRGRHLHEYTYMLSVLRFLLRHRAHFDSILCFGLYLFTGPAVLFGRLTGRPVVVRLESARETGDFHRISQLTTGSFLKRLARRAHAVIALSDEIEQELRLNGFPAGIIHRIPNAVDTGHFTPAPVFPPPEPFTICFTGRLVPEKDVATLLRACALVRQQGAEVCLLIAGAGPLRATLEHQAAELGLADLVTFIGEVADVRPCLHHAHAFVLPSRSEGLPLSMLEAMACGIAIVASAVGATPEVLGPSQDDQEQHPFRLCRNGILVPPGDPAALAAALERIHHDNRLCVQLGTAARAAVCARYCRPVVTQQYEALLEKLARR